MMGPPKKTLDAMAKKQRARMKKVLKKAKNVDWVAEHHLDVMQIRQYCFDTVAKVAEIAHNVDKRLEVISMCATIFADDARRGGDATRIKSEIFEALRRAGVELQ